jgi:hypothetical protein
MARKMLTAAQSNQQRGRNFFEACLSVFICVLLGFNCVFELCFSVFSTVFELCLNTVAMLNVES